MNRLYRINTWVAEHPLVAVVGMTAWFVVAAWHLIPRGMVTPDGHLIDPSTTYPQGYSVWSYTHMAYSDIYRLYAERNLWGHPFPYFKARIEYPVVTGIYMYLASLVHGAHGDFVASAIGLWAAGIVTLLALRRLLPYSYHWLALTPLLFVYSLLNWDLLAICFMVIGLVLARDERYAAAGIALAVGTCAKLFPIVYVPFLLARLVRDKRPGDARRLALTFVVTVAVLNLPFALLAFHNWTFFLSFNASRGGTGIIGLFGHSVRIEDAVIGLAVAACLVGGVRSVLRGGRMEQAAVVTFGVFLLLNKVYSPQYTLWLFVMALIAEWPAWTFLLLTAVGLEDFYGQFATLYITNASVQQTAATAWFAQMITPWVSRIRYTGIIVCGVGALLAGRSPVPVASDDAEAVRPEPEMALR